MQALFGLKGPYLLLEVFYLELQVIVAVLDLSQLVPRHVRLILIHFHSHLSLLNLGFLGLVLVIYEGVVVPQSLNQFLMLMVEFFGLDQLDVLFIDDRSLELIFLFEIFELFFASVELNVCFSNLAMHRVQFGFKFESQLDFLLVIFGVLHVLLLEPQPQRPFVGPVSLELLVALLQGSDVFL